MLVSYLGRTRTGTAFTANSWLGMSEAFAALARMAPDPHPEGPGRPEFAVTDHPRMTSVLNPGSPIQTPKTGWLNSSVCSHPPGRAQSESPRKTTDPPTAQFPSFCAAPRTAQKLMFLKRRGSARGLPPQSSHPSHGCKSLSRVIHTAPPAGRTSLGGSDQAKLRIHLEDNDGRP